jgi:hypothetical protein
MNATRFALFVGTSIALVFSAVPAAHSQVTLKEGAYLVGAFPSGDWAKVMGAGLGFDGTTVLRPDPAKPMAIRSEMGFGYNFSRSVDVPPANVGAGTALALETSCTSVWFGIGPEFSKAEGNVLPFVFGTAGLNVNWLNQGIKGTVAGGNYNANVGAAGTVFAWSAGGGLRKSMSSAPGGRVELSAEYRSGMNFHYVVPEEVTSTGATVHWDRTKHNADQVVVRLGTIF